MYWELWDAELNSLIDTFETEAEALEGVRDLLAANTPDYVEDLALIAMHSEGEPQDIELPPVLEGETLKSRLAALAQKSASDASREVHERIRTWLAEENWAVRDVSVPETVFNVMVTLQEGQPVNIYQRKDHLDHITIAQHWVFDDSFRSTFSQMAVETQREIVGDVYRDTLMTGVDLEGLNIPPNEMRYHAYAYFDGLTKDVLVQRILLVLRAHALSTRTLARVLEVAGRSEDAASRFLSLAS